LAGYPRPPSPHLFLSSCHGISLFPDCFFRPNRLSFFWQLFAARKMGPVLELLFSPRSGCCASSFLLMYIFFLLSRTPLLPAHLYEIDFRKTVFGETACPYPKRGHPFFSPVSALPLNGAFSTAAYRVINSARPTFFSGLSPPL